MRMSSRRFIWPLIGALALFLIACSTAGRAVISPTAKAGGEKTVWPHETSDLKPDPNLIFGKFPNGFSYILVKNKTPRDRVSMHLMVNAGSVQETDAQQGLAHFLEHMVFNGSTHFPPGELVKYFQRIGMEFGADANASTGFFRTVYDIVLPNGSAESIAEGLQVFGDFAEGAFLESAEIDRERKVILAEMRSRDSAAFRTFVDTLRFELPNDRISRRIPIGTKEDILKANRAALKDYYDTWYRPERMTLVMAGDFDPVAAKPLIKKQFADMAARAPARPDPDMGAVNHKGIETFYHYDPESGNTDVTLQVMHNVPLDADSFARERRELILDMANQVVQNRLDRMVRRPDNPFTSAAAASEIYPRHVGYSYVSAQSVPENWEKTLSVLDRTLRQALEYPFTDQELSRVKKDYLAALDKAVKNAPTRKSNMIARRILGDLEMNRVFQSPGQRKELYAPVIAGLGADETHRVFREAWDQDHRLVMVSGNARIGEEQPAAESLIASAYASSRKTAVSAPETGQAVAFPYLKTPENTARIARRKNISDLGIVQIDFENGVRLNLKPTTFKADEVTASLNFGKGRSVEPADKPGLARLSEAVVNESGLGAMDRDDLERALAGKNTAVRLDVASNAFALDAKSTTDELPLMFQLLHARLVDPGFREAAFALSMDRFHQTYEELSQRIEGAMPLEGVRFLAGGDSRFGIAPFTSVSRLTLQDVETWIRPAFARDPLELSIVGDFDVETAVNLASVYFGSLPPRAAADVHGRSDHIVFPKGKTLVVPVQTRIDKGMVNVSYPTDDIWNIGRTRRLTVLTSIFSDRLREVIREKLGATYSPDAYNDPSRTYPGYGVMSAVISVNPTDAKTVVAAVKGIADDIVQNGITDDEFKRAVDPILTGIKDLQQDNGYWLNTVLAGSREHPEQIEWSRSIIRDYTAITRPELRSLAREYLDNTAAAAVIVRPAAGLADRPTDRKAG